MQKKLKILIFNFLLILVFFTEAIAQVQVVGAKRDILKGKILEEEDLTYITIGYKQSGTFENINDLIGKKLKYNIKAGEVIKDFMLDDFDIKPNTKVKIIYDKNGIRIELLGRTVEGGKIGDIIKVKNISTNKVIKCKVLDANTVLYITGEN
ncbi:flagellar basal body P-ring formation chaperone FlgA [Venenivibrio stagnispumantis]|uniref:flagellar basal body P-ring formation chaperone FlgA n=1 Tax=Venenivibrio stagnispumantis TaxID=407998 RepID=UPI002236BBA4|nr:flagellar basal body P-ring formation chaperone FlgA [Venenivibrio stagnispumantis]MCW4572805.1 flagellar basal body P-ring formation chaperone FlgA [Venenivibrio stagnispumantis]